MADKRGTDAAEPSPAATDPTEAPASPELDTLKRERDDYHDRWLRKTAEFDNYRRRVERERREQADQSVVDLLQELLLVVDDFDRALTVEAGEDAGVTGRASSSFTPSSTTCCGGRASPDGRDWDRLRPERASGRGPRAEPGSSGR
jgi:hypothetical protein